MKRFLPLLLVVVPMLGEGEQVVEQKAEDALPEFKYKVYTAESGALYRTPNFRTNYDNDVFALKVDSKDCVWVGTPSGLGVYDGERWTHRTFENNWPAKLRLTLGLVTGTTCGPSYIEEGPPGTIWLGGSLGVWRYRGDTYEEVRSKIAGMNSMAADRDGNLWVVDRFQVFRYDGESWSMVLCQYVGRPGSFEASGFGKVIIDTNGMVWIGATAYRKMEPPFEHEGLIWIVDQDRKERAGGPPMAPLFEFDGSRWRAFGSQDGLDAFYRGRRGSPDRGTPRGWASPYLNHAGEFAVATPNGHFRWDGKSWKPVAAADPSEGQRWVLQMHGRFGDYGELYYRDGNRLVKVQPVNAQTGEVLDLKSDIFGSLKLVEDPARNCVWLGTWHGLYRIWAVGGREQENGR